MKITEAYLDVYDFDSGRFASASDHPDGPLLAADGKRFEILLRQSDRDRDLSRLEIRRYDNEPSEEIRVATGDSYHLVDWFIVHDPQTFLWDNEVRVEGYMTGTRGVRRDGLHPISGEQWTSALDGYFEPLVRVRWVFR